MIYIFQQNFDQFFLKYFFWAAILDPFKKNHPEYKMILKINSKYYYFSNLFSNVSILDLNPQ
jgi:hypothetical protein